MLTLTYLDISMIISIILLIVSLLLAYMTTEEMLRYFWISMSLVSTICLFIFSVLLYREYNGKKTSDDDDDDVELGLTPLSFTFTDSTILPDQDMNECLYLDVSNTTDVEMIDIAILPNTINLNVSNV